MQHVSRNWTTATREADFCGSVAILAEPTKVAEVARRLEITIRNAAGAIGGLRRKGLVRSAGDHKWIAVAEVSQ